MKTSPNHAHAPDSVKPTREPSALHTVLWIVQAILALLYLSGGAYKAFSFDEVGGQLGTLSLRGWAAVGVVEMVGAVLLIVPAATRWRPGLTTLAAAALTLEALGLTVLYARHSLALSAENPLVWSVVMALLTGFVAYGRARLRPIV